MNIKIKKYDPLLNYEPLLDVIRSEGKEWEEYLSPIYKKALEGSTTHVALADGVVCAYSRSMSDFGMFFIVLDLLVDTKYRGNAIGRKLLDRIVADYPDQEVFVLSDVDEYYKKQGYEKEGSIFKVM